MNIRSKGIRGGLKKYVARKFIICTLYILVPLDLERLHGWHKLHAC